MLLFQTSSQTLMGVIIETESFSIQGFIKCKEKECFHGIQGLRSPTIFLHSLQYVQQSLLQKQLQSFSKNITPKSLGSQLLVNTSLFRNGFCQEITSQCILRILQGKHPLEEENVCTESSSFLGMNTLANDLEKRVPDHSEIMNTMKEYSYFMDLPITVSEKDLHLQLLNESHPYHPQILKVFRVLSWVFAYHTNECSSLLPVTSFEDPSMPSSSSSYSKGFYKRMDQLMKKVNAIRTKQNKSWNDLQFIHSYFILMIQVNSSYISWNECEQVLLDVYS